MAQMSARLAIVPLPMPSESFIRCRRQMLLAFRSLIDAGHPASELLEEAKSTENAMRQLVEICRG
jgi:hypothetical protein